MHRLNTRPIIIIGTLCIMLIAVVVVGGKRNHETRKIASFEECAAAGFPILESYPRQCRDGLGVMHVEPTEMPVDVPPLSDPSAFVTTKKNADIIRLTAPRPGDVVSSPLTILGEARGPWFFEATFPVVLTNWDGLIIAEGYAEAEGEWMTTDFVPFRAILEFTSPEDIGPFSRRGALILKKNNASGLPEHDDALEIVVAYSTVAP